MSLTVKAYLEKDGKWDAEIRRFQMPADASSSFAYLHKKLCDIFPALRAGKFSLYWKDNDGDAVSFSTDEELLEALGFVTDSILKIFIKLNDDQGCDQRPSSEDQLHPGVICDGCEGPIRGPRFKCMACPDYDLCRTCEGKGLHMEHDMMKIMTPGNAGPFGFPGFPGPFGPCGPMGPHGPHGPHGPFQPPPHFRRWMQKFMRRWHNRKAPGWENGEKEEKKDEGTEEEEPQEGDAQGEGQEQGEGTDEEFLKSVGQSVAAMLDPFGIDVDIDIETRDRSGGKMRGRCGRGGGRGRGCHGGRGRCGGPPGAHGNPWSVWGCGRMGGHPACRQGCKQRSQEEKERSRKEKEAEASTSKGETMETEVPKTTEQPPSAPPAPQSPAMMDVQTDGEATTPKQGDADNGWTLLTEVTDSSPRQMTPEVRAAAPAPTGPAPPQGTQGSAPVRPPQLYPIANAKVAEALEQMLAMGFNNDGGWLTNLLEAKDGDIVQVLDALKPNPARRGDGGNLA